MKNVNTKIAVDPFTEMLITMTPVIKEEDVIEGTVIAITPTKVYVDLGSVGTGIIYGVEYINARDIIKKMNIGDIISTKIILKENKDGYVDLSLKEARHALIWGDAEKAITEGRVIELIAKEANKGGLIIDWRGITGFLPASQLKGEHYPKINDGNKENIVKELRKLVGIRLRVTILAAIPKEGKLIFTESIENATVLSGLESTETPKIKNKKNIREIETLIDYNPGDIVEGVVTGIVDFGIFIKINERIEGLIHKSEIDWGLVENIKNYAKIGEIIKVKVVEVKDGKISLSIKQLKENPWVEATKKYNKGDKINSVIIRFNKHGALASIEEGVAGLIHITDFENETKMKETLSLGKIYPLEITLFDPKEEKMTLSLIK